MNLPNPSSNNQINYLWKNENLLYRFNDSIKWTVFGGCVELFNKFIEQINKLVKLNKRDNEIYKEMRHYYLNTIVTDSKFSSCMSQSNRPNTQGNIIANIARKYLSNIIKNDKDIYYLDIGAGDCSITKNVANLLNIIYKNVYATEIYPKSSECNEINYLLVTNSILPNEFTNKFNLITCIMSLHHLDYETMIKELSRVIKNNGILIIREHDCISDNLVVYLDVLHGFHLMVFKDYMDDFRNYKAFYHSSSFWNKLLETHGFKQIFYRKRKGNTGEKYHAGYIKLSIKDEDTLEKESEEAIEIKKIKDLNKNTNEVNGGITNEVNGGVTSDDILDEYIDAPDIDYKIKMPNKAMIKGPYDFPKDDVSKRMLPDKISECSMIANNGSTCTSDEVINAISNIIGIKTHVDENNKYKVMELAKNKLNCKDERCVLTRKEIRNSISNHVIKKELLTNFKLPGPTDVSLLNNFNIDSILIQWNHKFHDFYPNNFNMVDYDKVGDTLQTVDIKSDVYDKGYRTFGCIINSDTYSGRGKHWMALFADMRGKDIWTAEFFNSSGNPPVESWLNWMRKTTNRFKDISNAYNLEIKKFKQIRVSRIVHQESQTECGVYALYYIWCRLNGISYEYFQNNIVPDKWMFEMRQHLYIDFKRPMMKKFKYGDFASSTKVKWEP